MDRRRAHHSQWFVVLIVLAIIGVGLYAFGVDGISLKIAWYRVRLLSDNPTTCVAQIKALAALNERGTPHLIWCVGHDVEAAQLAAITALKEQRALRACPALLRALDSGRPAVRLAANDALESLSGQNVGFDPYASWANRRNMVRLWEEWWVSQQMGENGVTSIFRPARDVAADGEPAADRTSSGP